MDDNETLLRRARLRELIDKCFGGVDKNLLDFIERKTGKRPNQGEFSSLKKDGGKSFGDKKARTITEQVGLHRQWFSMPLGSCVEKQHWLSPSPDTTSAFKPAEFDSNVTSVPFGKRPIPVISYVQAGLLTDINDPYAPGDGFAIEICEDDLGRFAFALEIEGDSMLPEFRPGDRVIIDPDVNPMPGDFVVAKNSHQKATFKKFRPRGMNEQGAQVFELVPLNEDYPTMRSDIEQLRIIGTMVEHRKKYRRKA